MGRSPGYIPGYPGIAAYIPEKKLVRKTCEKFQYLYFPFLLLQWSQIRQEVQVIPYWKEITLPCLSGSFSSRFISSNCCPRNHCYGTVQPTTSLRNVLCCCLINLVPFPKPKLKQEIKHEKTLMWGAVM